MVRMTKITRETVCSTVRVRIIANSINRAKKNFFSPVSYIQLLFFRIIYINQPDRMVRLKEIKNTKRFQIKVKIVPDQDWVEAT
jgi:hypothetical protein